MGDMRSSFFITSDAINNHIVRFHEKSRQPTGLAAFRMRCMKSKKQLYFETACAMQPVWKRRGSHASPVEPLCIKTAIPSFIGGNAGRGYCNNQMTLCQQIAKYQ
jgi:hypothetical protein